MMAAALGITVLAPTGDTGALSLAASSPYVTAVGGTGLVLSADGAVEDVLAGALAVGDVPVDERVAAAVERWAAKKTRAIGLRPEFPFGRLQAWAQSNAGTTLVERRKVAPFGIYTLVCFERTAGSQAA